MFTEEHCRKEHLRGVTSNGMARLKAVVVFRLDGISAQANCRGRQREIDILILVLKNFTTTIPLSSSICPIVPIPVSLFLSGSV